MIKIGNIETHINDGSTTIKVYRISILGNPFVMHAESDRELVCYKYDVYFHNKLNSGTDLKFIDELDRIFELSMINDITLLCWCHPKQCHGETIKRYIEARRRKYENNLSI